MFVTAFLGYLHLPTGQFTYVNAGHNPPLLKQDQAFDWLKGKSGFVLAGMEGMPYKEQMIQLSNHNRLFLYTDGVTEAVNQENQLFSEDRLMSMANQYADLSPKEFTEQIRKEIDCFAEGAEQADDITMLAVVLT